MRVTKVIKRDGRIVEFDSSRIRRAIERAMREVGSYNEAVLDKVVRYVLDVIEKTFTDERPPHVEEIQDIVELALMKYDLFEVAKAYIVYRKEREKIRKEKMAILGKDYVDDIDKRLSLNAIRLLATRYLQKGPDGRFLEDPKGLFIRIASLIVIPDVLYDPKVFDKEGNQEIHPYEEFDPEEWAGKLGLMGGDPENHLAPPFTWNSHHLERMKALYDELNSQRKMKVSWSTFLEMLRRGEFDHHYEDFLNYYRLMVDLKFLPNSPTLFNAGTRLGQLSACFVLPIEDSIESIMRAATEAAIIFKSGGGVGINYSKLRPQGDIVRSTGGQASGPVSFMRIIDVITDVVKQGGRRRGANMGILEIWHPDIVRFVEAKAKPGNLENFNLSVMITEDFWRYYESGEEYPLINPRSGDVWATLDPREIFRKIAEMAWRTGDPGVLFADNINRRNVLREYLGEIKSTNPCVSGDTRILTPEGWIRAEELFFRARLSGHVRAVAVDESLLGEGGEPRAYRTRLLTVDGEEMVYRDAEGNELRLLIPKEVEAWVWHVGKKPGLLVRTEEGYELMVTHDHRLLTQRGWKRARDLEPGDRIVVSRLHPWFLESSYRGSCDLEDDVAFALGWLLGGGSLDEHQAAWFFREGEAAAEERVRRGIERLGGNPLSHTRVLSGSEREVRYDEGTAVYRNLMGLMGSFGEGGWNGGLPEIVWRLNPGSLASFLRGLFTAEGRVSDDGSVRLASNDLEMLKEVQILLTTFGIASEIHEGLREGIPCDTVGGEASRRVGGCHELIIRGYSLRMFKELIGFESIAKLEGLLSTEAEVDPPLVTVRSVEEVGPVDFYDFTVPIYHQYVGNGLLSHNCGEEPLYPYESCNLGSMNLYAFIRRENGVTYFDWEDYSRSIRVALRFLDNVIDVNKFPIEEIERRTKESRKVGLGMMGLADALYALGIPYNSEEGFEFMRKAAEYLTYFAMLESVERAKERGSFPLFQKSGYVNGEMPVEGFYHPEMWNLDWDHLREQVMRHGIRNAEVTTIAPTGSISMIADVSSGIEPQFALVFEKRVTVGSFFYVDVEFERQLKENGLYSEKLLREVSENGGSIQGIEPPEGKEDEFRRMQRVFLVAYDIPWWDHIRAEAEISKWICAAVSKTINMPSWVSVSDIEKAYLFAHRLGLKGITVYRDGSKTAQVLVTPTQRRGEYVSFIENKTLEMMRSLGIEMPQLRKPKSEEKPLVQPVFKQPTPQPNHVETCPECGSTRIVHREDCVTCLDCGWSACVVT
ncbi:MAG: intein-containing adenosylcobalamin-dependent ribonucleoside-diphosphate reductase [Candidatus Korarchaeota archaeon NZ13-K]|nr:MAG: intein-containing adenosylcobalamin-dependent ribonucleoside-diphosphate reductase [Candidatus Korarchaeota archaeon NZ13-K]